MIIHAVLEEIKPIDKGDGTLVRTKTGQKIHFLRDLGKEDNVITVTIDTPSEPAREILVNYNELMRVLERLK